MMKKIILFALTVCFINASQAQSGGDSLLSFLLKNKSRASLYLQKNDYVIAKLNEDKLMPLEGTVKMIIAVEFAKQAAYNVFSFNSYVSLKDVNKYVIPNTNGEAQTNWLKAEKRATHIRNDSIRLIDVARGMIMFNSNANAEYLMDKLGFNNLQNDLHMFGLKQHTVIYPVVSSLFLYQNPKKLPEDKVLKQLQTMSNDDYYKAVYSVHDKIKTDSLFAENFRPQDFSLKMQKIWSDRLPASTTKEYARVCRIINSRLILDNRTYSILGKIVETTMENPSSKTWLDHSGMMGGTTIFVFTKALYATLKDGTKIELVYFFNDLTGKENYKLQTWMNDFELKVLKDEAFRKRITAGLEVKKK